MDAFNGTDNPQKTLDQTQISPCPTLEDTYLLTVLFGNGNGYEEVVPILRCVHYVTLDPNGIQVGLQDENTLLSNH